MTARRRGFVPRFFSRAGPADPCGFHSCSLLLAQQTADAQGGSGVASAAPPTTNDTVQRFRSPPYRRNRRSAGRPAALLSGLGSKTTTAHSAIVASEDSGMGRPGARRYIVLDDHTGSGMTRPLSLPISPGVPPLIGQNEPSNPCHVHRFCIQTVVFEPQPRRTSSKKRGRSESAPPSIPPHCSLVSHMPALVQDNEGAFTFPIRASMAQLLDGMQENHLTQRQNLLNDGRYPPDSGSTCS